MSNLLEKSSSWKGFQADSLESYHGNIFFFFPLVEHSLTISSCGCGPSDLNFVILVNEASCEFLTGTFIPLLNTGKKGKNVCCCSTQGWNRAILEKKLSKRKSLSCAQLKECQTRSSASDNDEVCVFLFAKGTGFKNNWIRNHHRATNRLCHMYLPILIRQLGHKTVPCSKSNDPLAWGKCNSSRGLFQQVLKLTVIQWHPRSAKQALLLPGNTRSMQPLHYISTKIQKQVILWERKSYS